MSITAEEIKGYLGPPRVYPEEARKELPAGVATGMAWTEMGGEVLFIEATLLPGGSGLTLTGQLGDVMKESAQAARSYLWSHATELGINPEIIKQNGVHIHVPAGAIPKDGPSAGVTMSSALASIYTGRKVRSDTSMTGEITLSGLVFPVGGIKEKVLAAHRAGIRRIVLPDRNEAGRRRDPGGRSQRTRDHTGKTDQRRPRRRFGKRIERPGTQVVLCSKRRGEKRRLRPPRITRHLSRAAAIDGAIILRYRAFGLAQMPD